MNQQGVTFLEIVVVIAILMITSALVAPSIQDWRQKRALENDFLAVVAQIDYLKARARTLNGTALLSCDVSSGCGSITYKVSTTNQINTDSVSGLFDAGLVENKQENILSGKSNVVSSICKQGQSAIFISTGQTGVVGDLKDTIQITIEPINNKSNSIVYQVRVNKSTGFIEKSRGKYDLTGQKIITWTDIE